MPSNKDGADRILSVAAQAMGRKGGQAKVSKGFANPDVMAKALKTRELNARQKAKAKKRPVPKTTPVSH